MFPNVSTSMAMMLDIALVPPNTLGKVVLKHEGIGIIAVPVPAKDDVVLPTTV